MSAERVSVCYVTENLVEYGILGLPWSYINEVINVLL